MVSLPAFEKYDEAEFDAWVEAHVAILREQQNADWRIDNESKIQGVLKRAGRIRERLVCGEAVLRPMPPDSRIPSWAAKLEAYLHYRGSADGGAGHSGGSSTPHQEPRVYVVPAAPANEPEPIPVEPEITPVQTINCGPGAPPLTDKQKRQQFGEVFDLERQGLNDKEIAHKLKVDPKTVQRRRTRYFEMMGREK